MTARPSKADASGDEMGEPWDTAFSGSLRQQTQRCIKGRSETEGQQRRGVRRSTMGPLRVR